MYRITIIWSLIVSTYGASIGNSIQLNDRIIGGHAINISQAPYQATFQVNGAYICGATVISKTFVLTIARCSVNFAVKEVSIRVGSSYSNSGGSVHQAHQIIIHDNFTTRPLLDNDIALVKVATPFVFSADVNSIALATTVPKFNSIVQASGWGITKEGGTTSVQLQQVLVAMSLQSDCERTYRFVLYNTMFCAGLSSGTNGVCSGDYGGPLVYDQQLVGVATTGEGCGRPHFPNVYTSVPVFRDWIKQHTGL